MRANKQLFEGGALGGGLQTEALTDIRPVFIVVGDFQPRALLVAAVLQGHAAAAQHQRVLQFQRRLQHIVRVNQYSVALPAAAGGDVVFRITLRAVFKAKAEVALFAVAVVIFEPPLAAAAKVFNQGAVGGGFAPEGIGEAAGRAEDLHRHVVAFALRRPHFRGIQVMRIAGVVEDQTVGFPRRQAQTAANDLLVKTHRLGGAEDGDQVDVRGVEAGGQHRDVHQIAIRLRFKGLDDAIPLRPRRFAGDQRRLAYRQQAGHFPGVFHGGGKDHHPFAVFGELHDLADNMRRDTLLFFQLMVKIGFAEQAVALRLQATEIVLHHRHIEALRRRQIAVFNHIAQR